MLKLVNGCVLLIVALAWDLPTDCRNQTVSGDGGKLAIMSYHIHYTSDKQAVWKEAKTFYEGFVKKFASRFKASEKRCPFGPNYGSYSSSTWPAKTMCSLEGPLEFEIAEGIDVGGNPWGGLNQRAFFVPIEYIDEAWAWARANRGDLDVVKHPNTGCMHDDHGVRRVWDGTPHTIYTLQFPCNMPATGCQDNDYSGPPDCGCQGKRRSDAPKDSCKNCVVMGSLPPDPDTIVVL